MCFKSEAPKPVQQTNEAILTPQQQELLGMGMQRVKKVTANKPRVPKTPGFDSQQRAAQEGILGKAGGVLQGLTGGGANVANFLSGDVLKAESNPALQGAIQGAIDPLRDEFLGTVLPGLRTNAVRAGALGGSRDALAGDLATKSYLRQVGNTAAGMENENYRAGLNAMVQGQSLLPQTLKAMLFPEVAQEAVGAQRRALDVAQGRDELAQYGMDFAEALQLLNAAGGIPGGGTTGTVVPSTPNEPSGFEKILGTASTLAPLLLL